VELRNFLLSSFDDEDMRTLSPQLREVSLQRGQVVSEEGRNVDHVYFPSSAVLSVVTVMSDGRCLESSSIGREGGAGLLEAASDSCSHHRIFAQVPGTAMRTSASAVRHLTRNSESFRDLVFRHALVEAAQIEQFVACNALHSAEQRLVRWLLMTADRTGSTRFQLTQDYLAVMTGVQRTTISALASDLRVRMLINYSRGNIQLLDVGGLKAVACECADVVHQLFVERRPAPDPVPA
jgi:CRP-like cAMP-binding protein